jgi:hypothetical protein
MHSEPNMLGNGAKRRDLDGLRGELRNAPEAR